MTQKLARTAILGTVLVAAPAGLSTPAAGAASSVAGQVASTLIVAPAESASVTGPSARIVVRRAAGAKTRALLNGRDVTSHFTRDQDRLVARLTTRQRLRAGMNTLTVVVTRSGRAAQREVRTFFLVRRQRFVRLKVERGTTTRALIDVVSGAPAAALARRPRTIRIRLNGRDVSASADEVTGTREGISLSKAQGLRHGVNRLSVRVTEPESGRYTVVAKRFRVSRSRPLADAGLDQQVQATVSPRRVRVGGHATPAAAGGRLSYRWRIVRRPAGSHVRLTGVTRPMASLVPDEPGRYVLEQRVTERGGSGGQVARTAVDQTGVDSLPPPLVSLSANSLPVDPRGIQIGDRFFPHPGDGATLQWLMVDRATFEPTGFKNKACCHGRQETSMEDLTKGLEAASPEDLVIITVPSGTLTPDEYDHLDKALELIGVAPLPASARAAGQQLVIVGIPQSGEGSGWVIRRSTSTEKLPTLGWLMADGSTARSGAEYDRFQPLSIPFNTSESSSVTTNVMRFGDVTVEAEDSYLRSSDAGGFQVVELDPREMRPVDRESHVFRSNNVTQGDPDLILSAMADSINAARSRGDYVAVQSIGNVRRDASNDQGWAQMADALAAMGANPDRINALNGGPYAFIGGPPLARREVEQAYAPIAGQARMRPDGLFGLESRPAGALTLSEAVFRKPIAWPYTQGGGPEGTDYDKAGKAIAYITGCLSELSQWAPNIRDAYFGQSDADWDGARDDLGHIYYPGTKPSKTVDPLARDCKEPSPVDFSIDLFSDVIAQLNKEFGMIAQAEKLIDHLRKGFNDSQGQQLPYLSELGEAVRTSIEPPDTELVSPVLGLLAAVSEIAEKVAEEDVPGIGPFLHLAADAYEIGTAAAEGPGHKPVGEQIDAKVTELAGRVQSSISDASENLEQLLRVGVSDWGRLQALDQIATSKTLPTQKDVESYLTVAAKQYFDTELLPIAFRTSYLLPAPAGSTGREENPVPTRCHDVGGAYRQNHKPDPSTATPNAWVPFRFPNQSGSIMLSRDSSRIPFVVFPPEDVTGPMFAPLDPPDKLGVDKSDWFWELGEPGQVYDCYTPR